MFYNSTVICRLQHLPNTFYLCHIKSVYDLGGNILKVMGSKSQYSWTRTRETYSEKSGVRLWGHRCKDLR